MDVDMVVVLGEGQVQEVGDPRVLVSQPRSVFAAMVKESARQAG